MIALAILAGVAWLGLALAHKAAQDIGYHRLAWRFLTGAHLDGRYRTNRGWFVRGGKVMHPSGRASAYAHAPRLLVAAVRLAAVLLALAAVVAWAAFRAVAVVALPACAVLLAAYGAWRGARHVLAARHRRRVVRPLSAALAVPLESTPAEVSRTLAVPRKIGPDSQVTAALGDHWQGTAGQIDAAARIVGQRLGYEWDARVSRAPFVLIVHRRPEPPGRVAFGEIADLIRREGSQTRYLIGLGTGREPVWLDVANLTAHTGLSCGPGAGKSSFLRLILAQASYHGVADFPCLDGKGGVSVAGMESLPGLRIYGEDREQWAALAELRQEMDGRYTAMLADPGRTFPLSFLIGDEMNDLAISWRSTWANMRQQDPALRRAPATPPVYDDLTRLLIKMREAGLRAYLGYQRLSAAACGGMNAGLMRDALHTKALARASAQAWDSLTGIRPRPEFTDHPGRWIVVQGSRVRAVQVAYAEADELLAFAASGRAHREAWANVPPVRVGASPAGGEGGTGTPETPERVAVVIGLDEAAARLRMTREGFRKARQRAGGSLPGEFRTADGRPGWPLPELLAWRPAAAEGVA